MAYSVYDLMRAYKALGISPSQAISLGLTAEQQKQVELWIQQNG